MELNGFPDIAFAIACRMAHVVKTLVGRAIHVAIVNGLKRKLYSLLAKRCVMYRHHSSSYIAATMYPLHFLSLRAEVKSRDALASPDSAIL